MCKPTVHLAVTPTHRDGPDGHRRATVSVIPRMLASVNMVARVATGAGILRLRVSAHKLRHTREVIDRRAGSTRRRALFDPLA